MFRCACAGGKRATLLAVGKRRLLGANARSESGWGRGGCQPAWHGVVPLSTNDRLPRDTSLRLALMLLGNQCVESCDTTGGGRASVWQSGDGGGGGGDGGTSGVWHKEEEGRVTVGGKRVVGRAAEGWHNCEKVCSDHAQPTRARAKSPPVGMAVASTTATMPSGTISQRVTFAEPWKQAASWKILLWMIPPEARKALQVQERSELLDPIGALLDVGPALSPAQAR